MYLRFCMVGFVMGDLVLIVSIIFMIIDEDIVYIQVNKSKDG